MTQVSASTSGSTKTKRKRESAASRKGKSSPKRRDNKTHVSYLEWDLATAATQVAKGLPTESLERVRGSLALSKKEFASVIQISERTMSRRKGERLLPPDESDRVYRFARLVQLATSVLGSEDDAREWMKEPNFALGHSTPLEYAKTEPGAGLVENLLGRIDHGIPI
jgi:putative toxin-antitoxin system antitoxin component (TIGR02293 family)